jgi:hypothetical protein
MDSIRMGTRIIGPDHGAFRDLKEEPFIETYRDFAELETILRSEKESPDQDYIRRFCRNNNWADFVNQIKHELEQLVPEKEPVKRKKPWQIL